jgi:hypothetical protein
VLFGDTGIDTFVFGQNFGHDVLADFQGGPGLSDKLEFSVNLFPNEAAFRAASQDIGTGVGPGVLVTIQGNTLTIMNTTLAQIHTDDLVFA